MEFRTRETEDLRSPVEHLRINWVYRPRDVQRFSNDTRLVFATMHSDICPLSSLRGKCTISHKSQFGDVDEYKKSPDHFYFNQVFDRFMHRWFEVLPTSTVVNVPENVKKALDSRWKYIVVEASKVKELTSDAKRCKRCVGYCASNDSVDCAVCHLTYHMSCVRPPLLKKPSRGFAWACGPCSRAQERKLEARRTPLIGGGTPDGDEEEVIEEEEEEAPAPTTSAATPEAGDDRPATDAEIAHAKMWPMRYLGIHCRVEDALQYDDRAIFPRAGSRLGPKHQATVLPWYGRPVELVKPIEIKKRFVRAPGKKEATKLSKETQAAIEADRAAKATRPKWIQDEPPGYVHRGEDLPNKDKLNSAILYFKMPQPGELSERGTGEPISKPNELVDAYMLKARKLAKTLGVQEYSVDFLDRALYLLQDTNFDADLALKQLKKTDPVGKWPETKNVIRKDLRDPALSFTAEDKKRFDEGVSKYGSELRGVRATVKTQSHADIVRYWYYWKKTPKGREIWGSFGGRRNTKKLKAENEAAAKLLDDIAHDQDDSAFDNGKIEKRSRKMICKHCSVRHARIWRRAPGVSPGQTIPGDGRSSKKEGLVLALCDRCARLWRKYAIKWENMDEIMKKLTQVGSKAWKKKLDPELLKEIENFNDNKSSHPSPVETPEPQIDASTGAEPAKKKARHSLADNAGTDAQGKKKTAPPAVPPPPPAPLPPLEVEMPKWKKFPCFVCQDFDTENDQLLKCRDCHLVVHRKCYGLGGDPRSSNKWSCDMCANDRKESASIVGPSVDPASYTYCCVLCPVEQTPRELLETPKASQKKKKDEREKEKERKELGLAQQMREAYQQQKRDSGKPVLPREALKRTADNNWVHVSCAIFVPEIKFSNAKTLDVAEGVPFALRFRSEQKCSVCNSNNRGAVLSCHASGCQKAFHVMCAMQAECKFGFDITPVKSSRRDSEAVLTLGKETGKISAVIWCKEHSATVKSIVHPINERINETGTTAIEFYAQSSKQADENVTGTTRKANQLDEYTKLTSVPDQRRTSTTGPLKVRKDSGSDSSAEKERQCATCDIDSTPKWWPVPQPEIQEVPAASEDVNMTNGYKVEPSFSRESSMRVEAILSNGVSSPHAERQRDMPAHVATTVVPGQRRSMSEVIAYECHKCHYRRLHPQPVEDKMEVEETVESPLISPVNGAQPPHQPMPSWGPLANIPAQPATHGTWPPPPTQFNGQVHAPPNPPPPFAHQRPAYGQVEASGYPHPRDSPYAPSHEAPPYPPPHDPSYPPHHEPNYPLSHEPSYPPRHDPYPPPPHESPYDPQLMHAPPHGQHPAYQQQTGPQMMPAHPGPPPPQGYHPPPHGGPPLHSLAPNGMQPHSPPHPHSMHVRRHSQSPYQASHTHPPPPPPSVHNHGYGHHHQSPVPHHQSPIALAPAPSPTSHVPPGSSIPPMGHARSAQHGASASASVRNLIE
jgi:hypothetical protein